MSSIAIKTGTVQSAESHCAAMLEICDSSGKCCNTSSNLNNPGLDRRSGKIDKYTEQSLLGSCAQKVRNIYKINIKDESSIIFFSKGNLVGNPHGAILTSSDPNGDDGCITQNVHSLTTFFLIGWYVEWITIQMNNGLEFLCVVNGFLDNGVNPVGPGKREVACYPSGAKKLS